MKFLAIITLLPTNHDGLAAPMPSPTRSLLVAYTSRNGHGPKVRAGAEITATAGLQLSAGATVRADVEFWAAISATDFRVGTPFQVEYAGRTVGSGEVIDART
jgi:hypothetical protein